MRVTTSPQRSVDRGMSHKSATKPGFTLTELMVAMSIIILLAALTVPAIISLSRGREVRDGSQIVQATVMGARDRATALRHPVGIRFVPSTTNSALSDTMIYVREANLFREGTVHVCRAESATVSDPADPSDASNKPGTFADQKDTTKPVQVVVGNGTNWKTSLGLQAGDRGVIRFMDAGPYYEFTYVGDTNMPERLRIEGSLPSVPAINIDTAEDTTDDKLYEHLSGLSAGIDYKMYTDNTELLVGTEPILLPQGAVIDLRLSKLQAKSNGIYEIMFSPDGKVLPPQSVEPWLSVWIRSDSAPVEQIPSTTTYAATTEGLEASHAIVVLQTGNGSVRSLRPVLEAASATPKFYDPTLYYNNAQNSSGAGL